MLWNFANGFLLADHEYLEFHGDWLSYWAYHFEQRISVETVNDDVQRWAIEMLVVEDVKDFDKALKLCSLINERVPSGAFFVDPKGLTIKAVASYVGKISNYEAHILANAAQLMSWFVNRIGRRLAKLVKGEVRLSSPSEMTLRPVADETDALIVALRNRPEWIWDGISAIYPAPENMTGILISDEMPVDSVEVFESGVLFKGGAKFDSGFGYFVTAQFQRNENLGWFYEVATYVENVEPAFANVESANNLNIRGFDSQETSLLGPWLSLDSKLYNIQKVSTSVLHGMANGKTSEAPFNLYAQQILGMSCIDNLEGNLEALVESQTEKKVSLGNLFEAMMFDSFDNLGYSVLLDVPSRGSTTPEIADRNFLAVPVVQRLFACGIFNPMGPTVTEFVLSQKFSGEYVILHLQRHPFSPQFESVIEFSNLDELEEALKYAVEKSLTYIPEFIDVDLPGSLSTENLRGLTSAIIIDKLRRLEPEYYANEGSLLDGANHIGKYLGRNWDRLSENNPDLEFEIFSEGTDGADAYFEVVSTMRHVTGFWVEISNAWDGSLNFLKSNGSNLGLFDVGPFVTIYSKIGDTSQAE